MMSKQGLDGGMRRGAVNAMETKKKELYVRWTPDDYARLKSRMSQAGVKSINAFIRKMALDGYIVKLDMEEIRELITLLRSVANGLKQLEKRADAEGYADAEEIKKMQQKMDEIWKTAREILAKLSVIR